MDLLSFAPFFFMLAVVYGALEVSDIIKNKGARAVIAMSLAAIAATNTEAVAFVTAIIPTATIFFVAFFFLGFLMKMAKGEKKDPIPLFVVLGLAIIFLTSGQIVHLDENTIAWIVLGIIGALFLAAYQQGGEGGGHHKG